jgi:3-hydroxyisobutyrate dehydrogenase-like beta-hydroxyacid dehydrogenase
MKVGFIGLGRMGSGMARRVMSGGHALAVFDVNSAQVQAFAGEGASARTSVGDLARASEVVITMLVEDAAVLDVALRPDGLVAAMPAGSVHLAMGTYGVGTIRRLEEAHTAAGQVLVAAPVLGRPDLAAAGQLGVVVAGHEDAVGRCEPLLQLIGKRIFRAGAKPEAATAIKLANNAVLGCAMVAMAEGFSLVRKYDVELQVFQDVMVEGLFAATAYKVYGQKMVDESYDQVGSPITVGLKDAKLIAEAASLAHVPMPSHDIYFQRLVGAVAHGDKDRDQAVLAREQARAAGIEPG